MVKTSRTSGGRTTSKTLSSSQLRSKFREFPKNFVTPQTEKVVIKQNKQEIVELSSGEGIFGSKKLFGVTVIKRDDSKKFGLTTGKSEGRNKVFDNRAKAEKFFKRQVELR